MNEPIPMNDSPNATTFWAGDLCYVLHDVWPEVCDLITFDNEASLYTLSDGRQFQLLGTAYGDGTYFDQNGNAYGVDSGTLGVIALDDIRDKDAWLEGGCIHNFEEPLYEWDCYDDEGLLVFGPVQIDTDPSYEDEDYSNEE